MFDNFTKERTKITPKSVQKASGKRPESVRGACGGQNSVYFKNTFTDSIMDNSNGFVGTFLDSTHHTTRITMQIADIGTASMDSLIARIDQYVDSIVNPEVHKYNLVNDDSGIFQFYSSNNNIKYKTQEKLTSNDEDGLFDFPETHEAIINAFGNPKASCHRL